MTRVWDKFHQVVSSEKIEKPNNLKVLGEKPNGQNRITKIDYGHLCMREEKRLFY